MILRHVSWIKTSVSVRLVIHITVTQHSPPQTLDTNTRNFSLAYPKKLLQCVQALLPQKLSLQERAASRVIKA